MAYYTYAKDPIGAFQEKEVGNWFEYSENTDSITGFTEDFPHKIWVCDGYRYGHVLKTRVIICIDEDEFGLPVTQKWYTKKHRIYG